MESLATELDRIIDQGRPALESINKNKLVEKRLPGKWSKKEIIGHMIDSAQSNIRRFVVAQYEDIPLITYNQDKWVASNNYQQWDDKELITLWYLLNRQIAQILRNMAEGVSERQCQTEALHSIEWLAEDYIKHLRHHLQQVLEGEPVPYP